MKHPVFMIFAKCDVDSMQSYSDRHFTSKEAAEDYIKDVLEPSDKEAGVYEPDYFTVLDMTFAFE